jgi:hypothetical protein
MLSGQDLGIKLQGFLEWLRNYGHLPYKKQQELLWELGRIKVGLGTLVASNQRIIKTPGVNNESIGLALREIVDSAFRQHRLWREHNHRQQYLDSATQLKSQINLTLSQFDT